MLPGVCLLFIVPGTRTISLSALSDVRCTARRAPEVQIFPSDTEPEAELHSTLIFFGYENGMAIKLLFSVWADTSTFCFLASLHGIDSWYSLHLQQINRFSCLILLLMYAQLLTVFILRI